MGKKRLGKIALYVSIGLASVIGVTSLAIAIQPEPEPRIPSELPLPRI